MPEAYDYVAKGEELAAVGRIADAERAFSRRSASTKRLTIAMACGMPSAGVVLLIKPMPKMTRAIDLYRQAVKLGTDIPATLHPYLILMTEVTWTKHSPSPPVGTSEGMPK